MQAFEDYMKTAFPYIEVAKKRTDDETRKLLLREVQRGPITGITPMVPMKGKSRLRTKVLNVEEVRRTDWAPKANNLLKKVGRIVPGRNDE